MPKDIDLSSSNKGIKKKKKKKKKKKNIIELGCRENREP